MNNIGGADEAYFRVTLLFGFRSFLALQIGLICVNFSTAWIYCIGRSFVRG